MIAMHPIVIKMCEKKPATSCVALILDAVQYLKTTGLTGLSDANDPFLNNSLARKECLRFIKLKCLHFLLDIPETSCLIFFQPNENCQSWYGFMEGDFSRDPEIRTFMALNTSWTMTLL